MRTLLSAVLTCLALTAPAAAAESAEQYCARLIANAEKGTAQMLEAGLLYYHGMYMGKPCVKVDYLRAFDLLRGAGATRDAQSLLTDLTDRANTGNPRAIWALGQMEKRGWIKKVPK